jgi:hypothetical protein
VVSAAFKVHRWIGICFGLATFLAFASGLTLHWHTYPFPTEAEVVRGYGAPLVAAELTDTRIPLGRSATLRHLNQRLVWEVEPLDGGAPRLLDARSGDTIAAISSGEASRVAARVVQGDSTVARTRLIREYDHFYWLGQPPLPAYRVSFDSPRRVDVYVAAGTGKVTAVMGWREKLSDLLGEKVHYLKIGALRTVTTPRFVIMGALATAVLTGALSGLVYGVPLLFRRMSGAQRWGPTLRSLHNVAGAMVGLFIVMWGTSSYLMLWYPTMDSSPGERDRVAGAPHPGEPLPLTPRAVIAAAHSPVFALRVAQLLDRPVYLAIHDDGAATLIDARSGLALSPVRDSLLETIVERYLGTPVRIQRITHLRGYDEYYHATQDGRGYSFDGNLRPLPVDRVDLADGREPSPLYVRADRGEVIGRVWADYRAFRWLGSGVHDLDFPVLFQRRPRLWSWAIQLPVVIGLLASASGLWLGISYVARAFTLRPGRPPYGARDEAREPDVAG